MTTFSFSTDSPADAKAGVLVAPVFTGPTAGPGADLAGLERAYRDAKLTGKKGETLLVTKRDGDRFAAGAVLLVGVGDRDDFDVTAMRRALARTAPSLGRFGHAATTFALAANGGSGSEAIQAAAEGLALGDYRFARYKSNDEDKRLTKITVLGDGAVKGGRDAVRRAEVLE